MTCNIVHTVVLQAKALSAAEEMDIDDLLLCRQRGIRRIQLSVARVVIF